MDVFLPPHGLFGAAGFSHAWIWALLVFVLVVAVLALAAFVVHLLFGAAAARAERCRFFLHLLACGLDRGQSAERVVTDLADSRTLDLGTRFHLVAAHLRAGVRLGPALAKVPRFLPPGIRAMISAGEELGDLRLVLPACRVAAQRAELGYAPGLLMPLFLLNLFAPILALWTVFYSVSLRPKLVAILAGVGNDLVAGPMSAGGGLVDLWPTAVVASVVIWLAAAIAFFAVLAGPRIREWFGVERLSWLFPWVRHRCHRDFAALLTALLDAGVPDARAFQLAAEATGRPGFVARARNAAGAMPAGEGLSEAINRLEPSGEFAWRMRNALRSGGRFLPAVTGWLASLELRAERAETMASEAFSIVVVLLQGLFVGFLVVSVFGLLIGLIESLL